MAQLCDACNNIDLDAALCSPGDGGAPHQTNFTALEASAAIGCPLCSSIIRRFWETHEDDTKPDRESRVLCNVWNWNEEAEDTKLGSACIVFSNSAIKPPPAGQVSWNVNLGIYVDEGSPLAKLRLIGGRPVPKLPSISQQAALAKEWLGVCLRDHGTSCPVPSTPHALPTRVIKVSENPSLVCTQRTPGLWIALSHRWGSEAQFTTTTSNLDVMCRGLPMDELPLTFRDAILMTRELGYDYVWIDSLCILQDSIEDWREESSKMQEYYKNAFLTLAIDSAEGDHAGFVETARRGDEWCATIPLRTKLADGGRCTANIRTNVDVLGLWLRTGNISKRAWCLQEDILSPRSLHFTSEFLAWECQGHRVTEADFSPVSVSESELSEVSKRFYLHPEASKSNRIIIEEPRYQEYFEPLRRWYNILDRYCQCLLTFGKDRLIAIEGIARETALQTGHTYLFGLWKEDFLFGLLWQIDARGAPPDVERAPSWSWAALDIEWGWGESANALFQLTYGVQQVDLASSEEDDSARLVVLEWPSKPSSHTIKVRGLMLAYDEWRARAPVLFRAYWRPPFTHTGALQWERCPEATALICSFDQDTIVSENTAEEESEKPGADGADSLLHDAQAWDKDALRDVWILQVLSARSAQGKKPLVFSLLVQPVEGRPNTFARVGIAEVPYVDDSHHTGWVTREIELE